MRVVNVVDLMRLEPDTEHPHGLLRPRVRHVVHRRQAGDLRVPRLSDADPPAHVPPPRSRPHARAWVQGGGDGHDAVRHGRAQRHGPLPSGDGRDRPCARPRSKAALVRQHMVDAPPITSTPTSTARTCPRYVDWTWTRLNVLVVNAGSSSLKLRCSTTTIGARTPWTGYPDDRQDIAALVSGTAFDVAGHRVVHGGDRSRRAGVIDPAVERVLLASLTWRRCINRPRGSAIDATRRALPGVPRSRALTRHSKRRCRGRGHLRVPGEWRARWGLRRFGFHGLSHAYARDGRARSPAYRSNSARVVSCHLGAGASLCAVGAADRSTPRWASRHSRAW